MSSTNRSQTRRKELDYYVTPKPAIKEFFSHWLQDLQGEFHDDFLCVGSRPDLANWIDPCSGGDEKHGMSYTEVIKEEFDPEVNDRLLTSIDIRQDSLAQRKEDYLTAVIDKDVYDVVITNPPFYIAREVIEKGLEDVKSGGYVVMLLRLNFFGSNERFKFFQKQLPTWYYVHHRRFSFMDKGGTDSIEYCHMVWKKDDDPKFTMLKVI